LGVVALQQVQKLLNIKHLILVSEDATLSLVIHPILLQLQVVALEEKDPLIHLLPVVQVVQERQADQLEMKQEQEILLLHVQLMESLKEMMEEQVLVLRVKLVAAVAVLEL
jgi:hypothetical protein